jgi:hypothetical protein
MQSSIHDLIRNKVSDKCLPFYIQQELVLDEFCSLLLKSW